MNEGKINNTPKVPVEKVELGKRTLPSEKTFGEQGGSPSMAERQRLGGGAA